MNYIIHLFFQFITYIKSIVHYFSKSKTQIFSIEKYNEINQGLCKGIFINWILYDKKYISYFENSSSLMNFPPYNFYILQTCKPEYKIIGGLLKSNSSSVINDITPFIKQLAGPKQNFYIDTDYPLYSQNVLGLCSKTLIIITLKKTYNFDLIINNKLDIS